VRGRSRRGGGGDVTGQAASIRVGWDDLLGIPLAKVLGDDYRSLVEQDLVSVGVTVFGQPGRMFITQGVPARDHRHDTAVASRRGARAGASGCEWGARFQGPRQVVGGRGWGGVRPQRDPEQTEEGGDGAAPT